MQFQVEQYLRQVEESWATTAVLWSARRCRCHLCSSGVSFTIFKMRIGRKTSASGRLVIARSRNTNRKRFHVGNLVTISAKLFHRRGRKSFKFVLNWKAWPKNSFKCRWTLKPRLAASSMDFERLQTVIFSNYLNFSKAKLCYVRFTSDCGLNF